VILGEGRSKAKSHSDEISKPPGNVVLIALVFLAMTGLHAIFEGRAAEPSIYTLTGFAFASLIAVRLRGAVSDKRP